MSAGQRPRTPIHFPRMKYRAAMRDRRAAFGHHRCVYVTIKADFKPLASEVAAAIAEIQDTARKMAEKTRVPTLWYRP